MNDPSTLLRSQAAIYAAMSSNMLAMADALDRGDHGTAKETNQKIALCAGALIKLLQNVGAIAPGTAAEVSDEISNSFSEMVPSTEAEKVEAGRTVFIAWFSSLPRVEDGIDVYVEERIHAQERILRLLAEIEPENLFWFLISWIDHLLSRGIFHAGGPALNPLPHIPDGNALTDEEILALTQEK